jgi:hypothetical protein
MRRHLLQSFRLRSDEFSARENTSARTVCPNGKTAAG